MATYTVIELAGRVGCSKAAVLAAIHRKELPAFPRVAGESKTGRKHFSIEVEAGDKWTTAQRKRFETRGAYGPLKLKNGKAAPRKAAVRTARKPKAPTQPFLPMLPDPTGAESVALLTEIRDLLRRLVAVWEDS